MLTTFNRQNCPDCLLLTGEPLQHVILELGTAKGDRQRLAVPLGVEDPSCAWWNRHSVWEEKELLTRSREISLIDLLEVSHGRVES